MPPGIFKYTTQGGIRWGVRLKFKDPDDIWRARAWRGFVKQGDAATFCEARRADRYREKFFPGTAAPQTVETYFQGWLEAYASRSFQYSTYLSYTRVLNRYVLPTGGHLPLTSLSPTDLKKILTSVQGKRRQTIRNIFTPLREGLAHAVADGPIPTNPALALTPHIRQIRDAKAHVLPFTPAQITILLRAAPAPSANPWSSIAATPGCPRNGWPNSSTPSAPRRPCRAAASTTSGTTSPAT